MARLLRGFWAADGFPERARGEDKRTAARHRRPAGLGCTVMDVAGAAADMADWRELTQGAPELARLGLARLHAAGLVMLGTLRRDGSPRISPVEPCITDGRLLVGAMTWSGKAADLRRDPRYVLHSVVSGPDSREGELKLYGLAVPADPGLGSAAKAWWSAYPPGTAVVFSLRIGQALFVAWDVDGGVITVHQWSPRDGYCHRSRPYP